MINTYDFSAFIARMAELERDEILFRANEEIGHIERLSHRVKGALKRREMGSEKYASQIKEFLFYMRFGTRPGSANDIDFLCYRRVIEALVLKKQLPAERLADFDHKRPI